MKNTTNISEDISDMKSLTSSQARDAINKMSTLIAKKPDPLKAKPIELVNWLESLIKLYKTYK